MDQYGPLWFAVGFQLQTAARGPAGRQRTRWYYVLWSGLATCLCLGWMVGRLGETSADVSVPCHLTQVFLGPTWLPEHDQQVREAFQEGN